MLKIFILCLCFIVPAFTEASKIATIHAKNHSHPNQKDGREKDSATDDRVSPSIWFDENGEMTSCGKKALHLLKSAPKHGINAKEFGKILHLTEGKLAAGGRAEAETMMQEAIILYINDLTGGKERETFAKKHPSLSKSVDAKKILIEGTEDGCLRLNHFIPTSHLYKSLQKALIKYHGYVKKATQEGDPAFKLETTLKKGSKGKDVFALRKYLAFYGYLDAAHSEVDDPKHDLFDEALEEVVKKFQAHHCWEGDGVIGPQTKHLFTITAEDRFNLIRLNLQRWRYLQYPLPSRHIIVNVAGYTVDALDDNKVTLSMRAVVGMPSRKTPLFEAPMTHFIFNPTWTVPDGIFYKDKLPKILSDPDYLERMGVFMKGHDGLPIDTDAVDWYDRSERPRITYPPGRSNPLGQVKFQIQNKFTIYLHDTNQKEYLKKNKRAKSSGCIRLEKPRELVAWLDKGDTYGDIDAVNAALTNRTTSWHPLKESVPVYFVYITTWVDEDGYLNFSDDPYKYDQEELKKFKNEKNSTLEDVDETALNEEVSA
ncbi:MAG: L,D-transpeptidase family protein [Alphaproteobacteria bacterium]|nr:L,D-transpeptidase family protein [Alphaproteobacteria bacterium]